MGYSRKMGETTIWGIHPVFSARARGEPVGDLRQGPAREAFSADMLKFRLGIPIGHDKTIHIIAQLTPSQFGK